MLMPSIFGESLFDDFMKDFPFYDRSGYETDGEETVRSSRR